MVALIGAIIMWWSRIEGLLMRDLISLRQHPACADFSSKRKFPAQASEAIEQWQQTRQLIYADNPGKLERAATLARDMLACSAERNVLVHYFWPYDGPSAPRMRLQSIKRKRGTHDVLEFWHAEVDVAGLDELNERMLRLYHRMLTSSMQLFVGPDRLPQRPFPQAPEAPTPSE